jgi:serine/threonine protein kinase
LCFPLKLETDINAVRYNPPEVDSQETYPIDANDLPKCDIWAYALGLWEILSDGTTYFQDSWRSQASYKRAWPDTLLSDGSGSTNADDIDVDCTPDSSTLASVKTKVSAFGSFDPKNLSGLADQFLKSINFGSAFIDKAVLRKLLSRALQVDPKDRPAKITLGPLMGNWK